MSTGRLFLVVGPSGAGKDTLLDAARVYFAKNEKVRFPQRYITRSAAAGGENHIEINYDDFARLKEEDGFAFFWEAHGLKYAIPKEVEADLQNGLNVVVNVSRGVIDDVRETYRDVSILSITVSPEELEKRLYARGRESKDTIARRLARAQAYRVEGRDVIEIDNSGSLEPAIKRFIGLLEGDSV